MNNKIKTMLQFYALVTIMMVGTSIYAQEHTTLPTKNNGRKVQKHTIMEKFAPEISLTVEERQQKRMDRLEEIRFRKSVLDTLDISERKRQKLLYDLIRNPFSNRLNKTMAEVKFEDADVVVED